MRTTKIEWTDKTWNPITGCSKHSAGCVHCYAEVMSKRLKAMGILKYENAFSITMHHNYLDEPIKWKKSCNIFVCSMSDLFHENVPFDFIDKVFDTIYSCPHHRFQILTKRAERMAEYFSTREVPNNAWIGVTVENVQAKSRIEYLQSINARIHFLSCEPLIEDLGSLSLDNIQWIIVGGESGPFARPMELSWVENIKKQADSNKIPFFFKQWGTWGVDGVKRNKNKNGKLLNGNIVQKMPKQKS